MDNVEKIEVVEEVKIEPEKKYSVGKGILKGLAHAGIFAAGIALTAGGAYVASPEAATVAFHNVPIAIPIGSVAFGFLGTFLQNLAKQKLLK